MRPALAAHWEGSEGIRILFPAVGAPRCAWLGHTVTAVHQPECGAALLPRGNVSCLAWHTAAASSCLSMSQLQCWGGAYRHFLLSLSTRTDLTLTLSPGQPGCMTMCLRASGSSCYGPYTRWNKSSRRYSFWLESLFLIQISAERTTPLEFITI